MKATADIRLVIRDLDENGDGVGTAAESPRALEVHVTGALPDEEISAHIDDVSSHRSVAWATLRAIHRPSADRVRPACRAQGKCGGCLLQHYALAAQCRWKESWLRNRIAAEPTLAGTPVSPIVASPLALGYRNNAKLVAAATAAVPPSNRAGAREGRADRLVLGAYARRTHQVIDLAGCMITEPALEPVAASVGEILSTAGVEPYDETRLTGLLRYVILRAAASGQVLVTLVTASSAFPEGPRIAEQLRVSHPNVVGVVHNINPTRGNALYGSQQDTLSGAASLEDQIGGVRLRISSRAFFQANRQVAHLAYEAIKRAAALTGHERVVDAYAGVGGIALTLAPGAGRVFGIEEHPAAVADATHSAALNGTTNATFAAGDVAAHLGALGSADVVVLNPPRKGCAPEVLRQVSMLRPRTIAYLSCAPETLIRDMVALSALNYGPSEIIPFDMLPHTPHIETLAVLAPRGALT